MAHEWAQAAFYRLAHLIGCHQRSDRSYFIRGRQIPVCARCFGALTGLLLVPAFRLDTLAASALLLPMLLDGGTQALGLRGSKNWLRFGTGLCFAVGSGALLIRASKCLWNI